MVDFGDYLLNMVLQDVFIVCQQVEFDYVVVKYFVEDFL